MWEYDIMNINTGEQSIIFGYSVSDAFRRYPKYSPNEWETISTQYID